MANMGMVVPAAGVGVEREVDAELGLGDEAADSADGLGWGSEDGSARRTRVESSLTREDEANVAREIRRTGCTTLSRGRDMVMCWVRVTWRNGD